MRSGSSGAVAAAGTDESIGCVQKTVLGVYRTAYGRRPQDFLDLFLIGSSPGVGTVVTFCFYPDFSLFLIRDDLTVRMKPVFCFKREERSCSRWVENFCVRVEFLPVGLGNRSWNIFREKGYALSLGSLKKA